MENCGRNWPNWAAPSLTICVAPEDTLSIVSRDEPSWPAGKTWISSAPPLCCFASAAMRSIIWDSGWLPGSTVDQRSTCAAWPRPGRSEEAAKEPAQANSWRRAAKILPIVFPPRDLAGDRNERGGRQEEIFRYLVPFLAPIRSSHIRNATTILSGVSGSSIGL